MTKKEIVYITILVLCVIILIVGALFDNHCETFLGILAIISGWVALAMCGYLILYCLFGLMLDK